MSYVLLKERLEKLLLPLRIIICWQSNVKKPVLPSFSTKGGLLSEVLLVCH